MLTPRQVESLRQQMFGPDGTSLYAIFDGAIVDELPARLDQSGLQHVCLFPGQLDPELAAVVPYLVALEADNPLTLEAIESGWMAHWGVYIQTPEGVGFRQMRQHFRPFLKVRGPLGEMMYFRYYDPRVLRVVLPTFDVSQRQSFFGPVRSLFVESESGAIALRFDAINGAEPKRLKLS
jgi:hypothetical protein